MSLSKGLCFAAIGMTLSSAIFAQTKSVNSVKLGQVITNSKGDAFVSDGHAFTSRYDTEVATFEKPCFSDVVRGNRLVSRFLSPKSFRERNMKPVIGFDNRIVCVKRGMKFDGGYWHKDKYETVEIGALFYDPSTNRFSYYDNFAQKEVLAWVRLVQESDGREIWLDVVNNIAFGPRVDEVTYNEAIEGANQFSFSEFDAGSWQMPTRFWREVSEQRGIYGTFSLGLQQGAEAVLPGMVAKSDALRNIIGTSFSPDNSESYQTVNGSNRHWALLDGGCSMVVGGEPGNLSDANMSGVFSLKCKFKNSARYILKSEVLKAFLERNPEILE